MLNLSNISAIEFYDDQKKYIRLFYQNEDCSIKVSHYDDEKKWYAKEGAIATDAKKHTPIAVSHWNKGTEIRLYYLNTSNKIIERVGKAKTTGDPFVWSSGDADLAKAEGLSTTSQLGVARPGKDNAVLRVYYQLANNTLGEIVYTKARNRWGVSSTRFPVAIGGTGLSAISAKPAGEIRLYYQGDDKQLKEHFLASNGHWAPTDLPAYTLMPRTSLSSLLWFQDQSNSSELQIRVYGVNSAKQVQEIRYDEGSWDDEVVMFKDKTYSTSDNNSGQVSAARRAEGAQDKIDVFFQSESQVIMEVNAMTKAIVPKGVPTSE